MVQHTPCGIIANNAAALKKLISFLSRSLCVVCRPTMKVCFVRCDHYFDHQFWWPMSPWLRWYPLFFHVNADFENYGLCCCRRAAVYPQPNHLATIYHSQLVHLNEDRIFWSWWSTSKAICKLGNVCMSLSCLLEGVFNCKYLRSNSLTKPLWGYDILYIIRTQLRQLHSCYPL